MGLKKSPIKFGTDGWRGIIADDFTFDNVRICAQAAAVYLKQSGLAGRGLVIGYDTRFASEDFARATAEVICGNGIKVYLCTKATPTPVISYGVLAKKAGGAVVITASHNPAQWNGFKYKSEDGASAPTEVIAEIEKNIAAIITSGKAKRLSLAEADKQGLVEHIDLAPLYQKQIKNFINLNELGKGKLKIVVDSMYGAGAGYFKMLLANSSHQIIEINGQRNPSFPDMKQPEPIAVNLDKLSTKAREEKADVGIATDGDADRLGIMDEKGNFLTQLQVFALLTLYLLEVRQQRGAIVKTITTTSMLDRLGEMFNVPVYETAIGFKYVAPIMLKENALVGGEESGGYGFRGHVPERDALLAGLYFIDLMLKTGKTPSQLLNYLYSKVGPHHYNRIDIEFPEEQRDTITSRVSSSSPKTLDGVKVIKKDTCDGFRFTLADTSWLLIRFSGTEPLLRIYTESDSPYRVERLLKIGRELAGV
ncbi:MAG: phosphoglucomutase/phosphomannomutase family protein [Dehalococcoidales bacterium]|nr:phosphoglucomutase/phosphomannomutase family protein [Dehalococcoidales bacterium]